MNAEKRVKKTDLESFFAKQLSFTYLAARIPKAKNVQRFLQSRLCLAVHLFLGKTKIYRVSEFQDDA